MRTEAEIQEARSNPIPYLVFNKYDAKTWTDFIALRNKLEGLREAVRIITNYGYSNSHFFITDVYGKLSLSFLPAQNGLHCWDYRRGTSLGLLTGNEIYETVYRLEQEEMYCIPGKHWLPKGADMVSYDFAGSVCRAHYNPQIHLPPDTSGD